MSYDIVRYVNTAVKSMCSITPTSYDVVRCRTMSCAVWTPLWATAWLDFVCGCIEPHHTSVRRFLQEASRKNLSNKAKCEKQETLRQWRGRSEAKATERRKAGVEWNNQWRWIDCASPETMHWHYDRQPVKSQPLFIERPFSADRTNGRALCYSVSSVCRLSVTLCIVMYCVSCVVRFFYLLELTLKRKFTTQWTPLESFQTLCLGNSANNFFKP